MSRDIDSFDKLREIEAELDSLKEYKEKVKEEKPYKPAADYTKIFLESINRSCMQMEVELAQVSKNLKELVLLFKAAMQGKSPEELEELSKDDKIKKLTEQNEELLTKLNALTRNMSMTSNYDLLNTDPTNPLNPPSTNKEDYLRRLL